MKKINQHKGFTLVEMSIVLVIIGLILGAVSIGKDLQREAEYNKIKQKFIDQWATAYQAYYQRTGVVLGDDETQPRFMVNGDSFDSNTANDNRISGGDMEVVEAPPAICQGKPGVNMARTADTDPSLHSYFDDHGIRMPPGRAEGLEDRYVYLDTNGNPQEMQVCFQWNKPETRSNSGNVMVITGLTVDMAKKLDQMIDGKPDAAMGMFRQENVAGTANDARADWTGSNTNVYVGTGGTAGSDAINAGVTQTSQTLDEDQIDVVVAHYKMTQ